ncbi:PREDICTED: uncharacterized protein LOC107166923 isoform X1 [Diuraphis noxia]|uniref:uncharacterized protein LOC107166923 isoform X1 n=1 Tax=Diuraphis noxia TaxID=143948 RepID=UPI0007635503|nr:PREDICTED: uncharacterized protein LOC107166923 isoform X1 [Diuraphis noxia]
MVPFKTQQSVKQTHRKTRVPFIDLITDQSEKLGLKKSKWPSYHTEVNAKVLFTLILVVNTLASGFVIRPYENIDYEVPDDIPESDESLDLDEEDTDTNYEDLPKTLSTTVSKVTNITPSTTTIVYDSDESYDDDYVSRPQHIMIIHDHINH